MAQNFKRYFLKDVGTTAQAFAATDSTDLIIGIHIANTELCQVLVDIWITNSGIDYYIGRLIPIMPGAALQFIDGGAKFVLEAGDTLNIVSDCESSLDVWLSVIDTISEV